MRKKRNSLEKFEYNDKGVAFCKATPVFFAEEVFTQKGCL